MPAVVCCAVLACAPSAQQPAEWFVSAGARGSGTAAAPFGTIQQAIAAAHAGDMISIANGTYTESLSTLRGGALGNPIRIRAASGRGGVLVTARGRVLTVGHPWIVVDGLILDGQYGDDDIVRLTTSASHFTLKDSEVRRTTHDAIDIGAPDDVLIEDSLIHHALNAAAGRTDAHGIVASAVHRLTVRNTEIHTFSGDGIQLDPDRAPPGWSDVLIENCRIWLAPLPSAENGFAAGTVTGENAVDTKAAPSFPRAKATIRNTEAWGFRGGIENMAAFNLKENVDVVVDGVTVRESEIAFRMRGPGSRGNGAWVRVQNAVVYDTEYAFRYEDNIERVEVWNSTLGRGVPHPFVAASSRAEGLDVRNLLMLGVRLPPEAARQSNMSVSAAAFVDLQGGDYRLAARSPAIDAGVSLPEVVHDRRGTPRPQGRAFDVGAYERIER